MKCFQLVLNDDEFLMKIFPQEVSFRKDFKQITEEMFTIEQSIKDVRLQKRIADKPTSFYLKQSREGGGHVYCGENLKEQINRTIVNEEENRYFLMSRVDSRIHSNFIFSLGQKNERLRKEEMNCELGVFGSLICVDGSIRSERLGGSLLRSKPSRNVEGGIASGQGAIDSILFIE